MLHGTIVDRYEYSELLNDDFIGLKIEERAYKWVIFLCFFHVLLNPSSKRQTSGVVEAGHCKTFADVLRQAACLHADLFYTGQFWYTTDEYNTTQMKLGNAPLNIVHICVVLVW